MEIYGWWCQYESIVYCMCTYGGAPVHVFFRNMSHTDPNKPSYRKGDGPFPEVPKDKSVPHGAVCLVDVKKCDMVQVSLRPSITNIT